jgi:hypothetical protein
MIWPKLAHRRTDRHMGDDVKTPEAHVVVAQAPDAAGGLVGPALYAVVADTPEEAEAAVQDVTPPDTIIAATGGPLKQETVERLALQPGLAKQIG